MRASLGGKCMAHPRATTTSPSSRAPAPRGWSSGRLVGRGGCGGGWSALRGTMQRRGVRLVRNVGRKGRSRLVRNVGMTARRRTRPRNCGRTGTSSRRVQASNTAPASPAGAMPSDADTSPAHRKDRSRNHMCARWRGPAAASGARLADAIAYSQTCASVEVILFNFEQHRASSDRESWRRHPLHFCANLRCRDARPRLRAFQGLGRSPPHRAPPLCPWLGSRRLCPTCS